MTIPCLVVTCVVDWPNLIDHAVRVDPCFHFVVVVDEDDFCIVLLLDEESKQSY